MRRVSPSTARNREPILTVLQAWLPESGLVLEVAAGAGEHAVFFAAALPGVVWQPSDPDDEALASIAAWRDLSGLGNVAAPLRLDVADVAWPVAQAEAVVNINMIHISPWGAARGLMAGAARVLVPGGALVLYGPFVEDGVETAASNVAFDASLKARNPAWGIRRLDDVVALAAGFGLRFAERRDMPANNLMLLFRNTP